MTKKSNKSVDLPETVDYRELSTELAELLELLEQGELGIDESVRHYERGLEIITRLESHLLQAENRVIELKAQQYTDEESEEE
jgi:exodeoxyribonuclease VII small subunit